MNWQKLLVGEFSLKRFVKSVAFFVVTLYSYFFYYMYFEAEGIIFQPSPSSYQDDDSIIKISSGEDLLSAKYMKNSKAKYTVLYSHGNAEDLGEIRFFLKDLYEQGFSVMAYDYSGYGTSTGESSELKAYENILAVYDYLLKDGLKSENIIIFGRSVGSGPSTELASKRANAGLILQSPFTSASRVLTKYRLFPKEYFKNLSKISGLKSPLLIIHGQQDRIIAPWHGEELYEEARVEKFILRVEGAGHDDVDYVGAKAYWQALVRFSQSL